MSDLVGYPEDRFSHNEAHLSNELRKTIRYEAFQSILSLLCKDLNKFNNLGMNARFFLSYLNWHFNGEFCSKKWFSTISKRNFVKEVTA